MRIQGLASGIAIVATSLSAAVFGDAHAQSAGADAEIAALKQQLRLMEQKLDKLQRQTAANTTAAATANAKADAKVSVANAAAYPVKSQIAPSDAVVKMPNNRPTICTADDQNCISIVSPGPLAAYAAISTMDSCSAASRFIRKSARAATASSG